VGSDLILYQFSRAKVEHGDFNHLLGIYAPDNLPTGRLALRRSVPVR
jgi:hypothetical protein